jgi:hypothetical protein
VVALPYAREKKKGVIVENERKGRFIARVRALH